MPFVYPRHLATRGRLDGEYGIATRGYIICPDIVPRFPAVGMVSDSDENLLGVISELVIEAWLLDDALVASLRSFRDLDAVLGLTRVLTASVNDGRFDLEAQVVDARGQLLAVVECPEDASADVGAGAIVGDVTMNQDQGASVVCDGDVAVVDERPGEGSPKRSGDPC